MVSLEALNAILDRLVEGKPTEADGVALRQVLSNILSGVDSEQRQIVIQLGKYNVNIRENPEGKELQIGDRTFREVNDETMKVLTRAQNQTRINE